MLPPALSMRAEALARRLKRLAGIRTPPPPRPGADRAAYDPSRRSARLIAEAPRQLARSRHADLPVADWQAQARAKLTELTGYPLERPVPEVVHNAPYTAPDGRALREVVLAAEGELMAPLMLALPEGGAEPRPLILCLQGTNSGFHLSWGEAREPVDRVRIANGGDFLRQAVAQGYAAAALEMRGFGRRAERALPRRSPGHSIDHALHLMLTGRSLIGERAADVSLALDWLIAEAPGLGIDPKMIYVMGQSAGGSVALYATALDTRIAGAILSGCVGLASETYGARGDRAGQNVVPGFLNWMETDDVLALCAPRPVLVMSGTKDHIYPAAGARKVCDSALGAWREADRLRFLWPEGPHRFYPDAAWAAFAELNGLTKRDQS